MGLFDKVKDAVSGNEDAVRKGVDKAKDVVNERTDSKYSDKINSAGDALSKHLTGEEAQQEGAQPEGQPGDNPAPEGQ